MPTLYERVRNFLLYFLPVGVVVISLLQPKLELWGIGRTLSLGVNNASCVAIPDTEACEDAWVHEDSGAAYLACSSIADKQHWLPGAYVLDGAHTPAVSTDRIVHYDFSTKKSTTLTLTNLPSSSNGIWVHGMTGYAGEEGKITLFLVSHPPPVEREKAGQVGADSVVEVFETRVGSREARWVYTVESELVRTPNAVAAVSETGVYVTNDHADKISFTRYTETIYATKSTDIVYCDFKSGTTECNVAVDGIYYPNGIAKGRGNTFYSAGSLDGHIKIWESQADNTLVLIDDVDIKRPLDNVKFAADGSVYAAAFPKALALLNAITPGSTSLSPVEVWRVRDETSQDQYFGKKYDAELVFADDGNVISTVTTGVAYGNQLLLTGVKAKNAVVCSMQ
ncbi:arylesterase / paraoxonase [Pseudohyphozyma bogoriensis]|nr:arylesterase / paraoxonase [Pseudohyphozyma bogoriensis]